MTKIPIEQLLYFNTQGLIPGPDESAEEFAKRADYCLQLKSHLSTELKASLDSKESASPELLSPANEKLKLLYDFSPQWIPLFFSNYKLTAWHGGCAWIFQVAQDTPTAAIIQLRRTLQTSPRYLGIYHRDELLAHELAHVGRMEFNEPKFEELLAYNTSESTFRKWFGPIMQSSTESVVMVLLLFLIIVFDIFLIAMHRTDAYLMTWWLKTIPLALIGFGLLRLWKRHRIYNSCLEKLTDHLKSDFKARSVAYRLRDKEIILFANLNGEEIQCYAEEQAKKELRWQVILKAYF